MREEPMILGGQRGSDEIWRKSVSRQLDATGSISTARFVEGHTAAVDDDGGGGRIVQESGRKPANAKPERQRG
jgi:hypothetical protein